MSVYLKLMRARVRLNQTELKKSGHNKFAGYRYFELGDFLPTVQAIFLDLKLAGVVSFEDAAARLVVLDVENPADQIVFSSPVSTAELKGCHPVQNLGAVQTYTRRYLWTMALEIVEGDALDSTVGMEPPPKPKAEPKPEPKPEATNLAGQEGEWQLIVEAPEGVDWSTAVLDTVKLVLGTTTNAGDVQTIYRKNKVIFDRLKEENKEAYETILTLFKTRKTELTKE